METYVYTKTSTWMFIVAFFEKAPNWKQAHCPWTSEQLNKLWYSHITACCLTAKRNEPPIHATTQKSLKCTVLSEISQTPKSMCLRIPFVRHSGKGKNLGIENRSAVARVQGQGWGDWLQRGMRDPFGGQWKCSRSWPAWAAATKLHTFATTATVQNNCVLKKEKLYFT